MRRYCLIFTKIIVTSILIAVSLLLLYLLCAFLFSRITINPVDYSNNKNIDIYILSNGFHSDVVVPIKSEVMDWSKIVKFEHTISNDSSFNFIAFGWGDRDFYINTPLWSDLQFDVAFQALFLLNSSAIHATFFKYMFQSESCIKISVSNQDYQKLVEFILGELVLDADRNVIQIENLQYDDNDVFYEAQGSFTLFYTCNTWVNDALKSANQKACLWTPFEEGIFYQYRD